MNNQRKIFEIVTWEKIIFLSNETNYVEILIFLNEIAFLFVA
jgi:hypothetical protein